LGVGLVLNIFGQNSHQSPHDVIIRNSTIYDGTGGEPRRF
jgi:hypothetical protein